MSNARFSILQARAVKDKRISDSQFRTLAALGMYANEEGWCFPSLATLGNDLSKSKQAVGRDTIALRKLGYLEVKSRFDEKGSRRSSLYRLKYDLPPVNVDDSTPSTLEVDTPSTPEVDVNDLKNDQFNFRKTSKNEILGIEASMIGQRKTTTNDIDPARNEHNALIAFEYAFGVTHGRIAWHGVKKEWTRLRAFLTDLHLKDNDCFRKYRAWYDNTGKFKKAYGVMDLKRDPDGFALSWDMFMSEAGNPDKKIPSSRNLND